VWIAVGLYPVSPYPQSNAMSPWVMSLKAHALPEPVLELQAVRFVLLGELAVPYSFCAIW